MEPCLAQLTAPFDIDTTEDISISIISSRTLKMKEDVLKMLSEKITKIEESMKEIKSIQAKAQELKNEKLLKFAMIGVNEATKTIAELIVLEIVLDTMNELIDVDNTEEVGYVIPTDLKHQMPGTDEVLGYISLRYKDALSNECQVLKSLIDSVQHQTVTDRLFRNAAE